MAATADQIARVRRMTAEPAPTSSYSDGDIADAIERYPLLDARGEEPTRESVTTPGAIEANPDWIDTYCLHAAAADIWDEKASNHAVNYNFNADGGRYDRSQVYEQMMNQARYYRSRRAATSANLRPLPLARSTPAQTTYTIAGEILDALAAPVAGVELVGFVQAHQVPPGPVTTDAAGEYSGVVLSGFTGTVIPTLAGVTFTPASVTYINIRANMTGEDYTAT